MQARRVGGREVTVPTVRRGFLFPLLCIATELFPNKLRVLNNPKLAPFTHVACDVARIGDIRRADFRCPLCNFNHAMQREPYPESPTNAWIAVLDVRITLDEYMSDSTSYANGCRYKLGKASRWGRDMGIPAMIAHGKEDLSRMASDHRQI